MRIRAPFVPPAALAARPPTVAALRMAMICVTATAVAGVGMARAEEASPGSREGWGSLFDGTSLDGWRASGPAGTFAARDGALVAPGTAAGWLVREGLPPWRDFELRAEVFTAPGASAGILFHTERREDGPLEKGYEVRIHNSCRPPPGAGVESCDPRVTGSLVATRGLYKSAARDGEWFPLEITVRGSRVWVRVNGVAVVDYVEPRGVKRRGPGRLLGEGTFAIRSGREGEVRFRKMAARTPAVTDPMGIDGPAPPADPRLDDLEERGYPIINFHVHLKGGLTLDDALAESRRTGIPYGIAVNCGANFPVKSDAALLEALAAVAGRPVFTAVQAEGREWVGLVSPESVARFDYVFSDSMTFTDDRGRRMRLWIPEEVHVEDAQAFMDLLVARTVRIIEEEPIDIYVNPTFIPDALRGRYDELWTDERMDRVIRAAVKSGVAIEINPRFRLPSPRFIRRAKAAGARFSIGTNNGDRDVGSLDWAFDRIAECGIEPGDLFLPKPDARKPVRVKGMPNPDRAAGTSQPGS